MQVVGLDPRLDEGPHQGAEHGRIVVHALQKDGLADHRQAGVHELGAGGADLGGHLPGVIGVQGNIDRLARALQRLDQVVGDRLRIDGRDAGMEADHLHMVDLGQPLRQLSQSPRRQHQGIAAGDDHLPDLGVLGHIGQRCVERLGRQWLEAVGADHFAPKAEPAIDRAGVGDLQQHAVRVAMDDPFDRAVGEVTDRVGALQIVHLQLGLGGQELASDGVGGIGWVDQLGQGRSDGHRILRRHAFEGGQPLRRDQAGVGERLRAAEGGGGGHGAHMAHAGPSRKFGALHGAAAYSPGVGASGVQSTCSMRVAPVASITNRSKPRADPQASGM